MKDFMDKIKEISFTSFQEIYDMKSKAKKIYASFDSETKEIYKWYYYHQLCLMTNKKMCLKDCLWLYIVGKDNILKKLEEEYDKFNLKVTKMKNKYDKNPLNSECFSISDIFNL